MLPDDCLGDYTAYEEEKHRVIGEIIKIVQCTIKRIQTAMTPV